MADNVPAAGSLRLYHVIFKNVRILEKRKIAIEIIAAGMDDENVKPTFKPRYTLDAVKK